jgi:hypothetical protein
MTPPTLTLDTSVVLVDPDEPAANTVAELFRRARVGDFDIAICTRVAFQIKRPLADPSLSAFIESRPRILPAGRYADPDNLDIPVDTYGGAVYGGAPEPRPQARAGDRIDDDILEAHRRSGRNHLVSLDTGQLKQRRDTDYPR